MDKDQFDDLISSYKCKVANATIAYGRNNAGLADTLVTEACAIRDDIWSQFEKLLKQGEEYKLLAGLMLDPENRPPQFSLNDAWQEYLKIAPEIKAEL